MSLNTNSQFSTKIKSKFKWKTLDCRTQRKSSGFRMWLESHEHGIKSKYTQGKVGQVGLIKIKNLCLQFDSGIWFQGRGKELAIQERQQNKMQKTKEKYYIRTGWYLSMGWERKQRVGSPMKCEEN